MKVLLVSNTGFNFYKFHLPLIYSLREKGFKISLASARDEYADRLRKEFEYFFLKNLDRKSVNPIKEFKLFKELYGLYSRVQPNVVVHITIKPNIWGSFAARLLNIPSVAIVTGLGYIFIAKKFPLYQIVKNLYKAALKRTKRVIVLNEEDASFFLKEGIVSEEKLRLIWGSGIDLQRFKNFEFYSQTGKVNKKFTFGYIGRFLWDKGLGELIEAAKILKKKGYDFELIMAGKPDEGNPRSVPMEKVKEWEKRGLITYKGFVDDVRQVLSEVDCFVYPSYREGLPQAVLEAMAAKKPIITTNVPGCRNLVINGKNGLLVTPGNPEELAAAMERVMRMPKTELQKMGEESFKIVKDNFSTEVVIPQYVRVIEEALKG